MTDAASFPPGGYRYLPGPFQYSAGVAAEHGFAIERARFREPRPLADGFAAVEAHLALIGRPLSAFAACELRSPAPLSGSGFEEFNRRYVETLARWGLLRNEANPVARTNVCPARGAPPAPALHAFSYTIPCVAPARDFVLSGGGEVRDGPGPYAARIVRGGETTMDAMIEKIRCVMGKMEDRLRRLGFAWTDALAVRAYTVHDFGALADRELLRPTGGRCDLEWSFSRPPLAGVDFEMDARAVSREIVL